MPKRKAGLVGVCRITTAGVRCGYPQLRMPSGALSPMCYWHRISRTSMDAQIREADRRAEAVPEEARRTRIPPAEWPDGERWCAGCQGFVPLWYCTLSRCKACAAKASRASYRLSKYGLQTGDTRRILEVQGDRCAICRKRQTDRALATDHNHKTGAVRGMLCHSCNHRLLGGAYDSLNMILAAAVYLVVPPTSGEWLDPEIHGDAVRRGLLALVDDIVQGLSTEDRAVRAQRRAAETALRARIGPCPTCRHDWGTDTWPGPVGDQYSGCETCGWNEQPVA